MSTGTMKALRAQPPGKAGVETIPIPQLRPDYILVRTRAVALNPSDWKHMDRILQAPAKLGCDYAGDVVAVGEQVTKPFKKGDRVCGVVHGGNATNPEDGAFGEYLVAKGDIQMRIPDGMSYEEAATLGVGIITIGQGLYQTMGLPWPDAPEKEKEAQRQPILIYGGSTATGSLAIQWAKLSGCDVITTCSPRNFDYVKSLGAAHAVDYNAADADAQIRKLTNNALYLAYDTIGEAGSPKLCAAALSSHPRSDNGQPPLFVGISREKCPRDDVKSVLTMGYTVMGETFEKLGTKFEARPEDYKAAVEMTSKAEIYLAQGLFKPHRHEVREGGFDRLLNGFDDLRNGRVSGVKLVYRV